jgi:galactokinase
MTCGILWTMGSGCTARLSQARATYLSVFGAAAAAACDAPGRVNLIGEHIDYAGGSVLPFAIQHGVAVAVDRSVGSSTATLLIATGGPVQPGTEQLDRARRLIEEILARLGATGGGWQFALWSDLPIGAGLSSSAACAVAAAGAICAAAVIRPRPSALVLCQIARDAEEAALGVQCGLMDQYTSMFGKAGHAVHFGTVSRAHEYIPLRLSDAVLAVIDSGQRRALSATGYNDRRAELAAGLRSRLRHVQSEKKRVIAAVKALQGSDAGKLGELLNASHASLRDDYEVSTPELDLLCKSLLEEGLAYGARVTGAGFGGSIIALLKPQAVEPACIGECAVHLVLSKYEAETGLQATLRLVKASDGALVQAGDDAPLLLRDLLTPQRTEVPLEPRISGLAGATP